MARRITAIPQNIMFQISLFPHNVPLPAPKSTGRVLGLLFHVLHLVAKWSAIRPDHGDVGWEDMTRELGKKWEEDESEGMQWVSNLKSVLFCV
jgi:hypothetical protein